MVRRITTCFLLIILISSNSMAQSQSTDPYEGGEKDQEIRPYTVTAIKSVIVMENGAWHNGVSGDETPEMCAAFILRKSDVTEFFRRARRVSYFKYWNGLDMSRCHATGEISFVNGDRGSWMIDLERRGVLTVSDGRKFYFYCTKCRAKVFDEY
jgi:hypothetical protein